MADTHSQDAGRPVLAPWSRTPAKVAEELSVLMDQGLDRQEAARRRSGFGPNALRGKKAKSAAQILAEQFKSLIMVFLGIAAVLSFAFSQYVDAMAIIAAMLLNAGIGFFTELKAVRSMEALTRLDKRHTHVMRGGKLKKIDARKLVPGDIVHLESGQVVTADIRLFESAKLQINESALTGESLPVTKTVQPLPEDISLAERTNMLYKGTAVTMGSGKGIVCATGMNTEIGNISTLAEEAEQEADPLEKRLDRLARRLILVIIGVAALTGIAGILSGRDLFLMLETTIVLIVAAIPEGLPVVATVSLARGMRRMIKRNALVRRLSAVQTLGATNIIITDKTGTLTENQMTVTRLVMPELTVEVEGEGLDTENTIRGKDGAEVSFSRDSTAYRLIESAMLCTNASLAEKQGDLRPLGDPMEVALLVLGRKAGFSKDALLDQKPEEKEVAFDPRVKMMATIHRVQPGFQAMVKGAPEAVLHACTRIAAPGGDTDFSDAQKEKWEATNRQMADSGLRILAIASKTIDSADADPYRDLTLLGYTGIYDPPRREVIPAIRECKQAGIKVIMATGDQAVTAGNVARAVELIDPDHSDPLMLEGKDLECLEDLTTQEREEILSCAVFYRVSPEQKLNLIRIYQEAGNIVGMTGDGVNDAPALKKAEIGIAMGRRGEEIAKEAADIILQDDAFSTIVAAVEHGRSIFNNIRKFVLYLISGNMGEILIVAAASLFTAPLPLLPLQILYLNAINDAFPALALGMSDEGPDVMERPPRDPKEPIITRYNWAFIGYYGFVIAACVLAVFALALYYFRFSNTEAVTVSFLSLAFSRLLHVFNMRDTRSKMFDNLVIKNKFIWAALTLCTGLILCALLIPFLAGILSLTLPGRTGWLLIAAGSITPLIIGQITKGIAKKLPERWHID